MYQPFKQGAALVLLAFVAMHSVTAFAAGPAPITETKPAPPEDTSVDRIEKLTRLVKIAELEKQLREAKASSAPIPVQGQGAPSNIPAIGFNMSMGAPAVNAQKPAPVEPGVQSITSIGGVTSAVSTEGRSLAVGTEMMVGNTSWKVTNIAPHGVTFLKCIKAKCSSTTLAVGR